MTPAQWTPRLVQQSLREAFAIELRLPDPERPRSFASVWPALPVHDFREWLTGRTFVTGSGSLGPR